MEEVKTKDLDSEVLGGSSGDSRFSGRFRGRSAGDFAGGRIAEIRQRVEAATPGPWELDKHFQCYLWGPNAAMIADDGLEFNDEAAYLFRMRGVGAGLPLKQNGKFIAHARTDIPWLLDCHEAMLEALRVLAGRQCGSDCTVRYMVVDPQDPLTKDNPRPMKRCAACIARAALAKAEGMA